MDAQHKLHDAIEVLEGLFYDGLSCGIQVSWLNNYGQVMPPVALAAKYIQGCAFLFDLANDEIPSTQVREALILSASIGLTLLKTAPQLLYSESSKTKSQ